MRRNWLLSLTALLIAAGCTGGPPPESDADVRAKLDAQATEIAALRSALPGPTGTPSAPGFQGTPHAPPALGPTPTSAHPTPTPRTSEPAPAEFYETFLNDRKAVLRQRIDAPLIGDGSVQTILLANNADCGSCNVFTMYVFQGEWLRFEKTGAFSEVAPRKDGRGFDLVYPDPTLDQFLCCPKRFVVQAHKWTGAKFEAEGRPVPIAPLELPSPATVFHTYFGDPDVRLLGISVLAGSSTTLGELRDKLQDAASRNDSGGWYAWLNRARVWAPPPEPFVERLLQDDSFGKIAYALMLRLLDDTSARAFLSPWAYRRVNDNAMKFDAAQIGSYYAAALDRSYSGKPVPSPKDFWIALLENSKSVQPVTRQWPLRALAVDWAHWSPAYQYAIEPKNAYSIWLVAAAAYAFADEKAAFDRAYSNYRSKAAGDPGLTWPGYLWQAFGK